MLRDEKTSTLARFDVESFDELFLSPEKRHEMRSDRRKLLGGGEPRPSGPVTALAPHSDEATAPHSDSQSMQQRWQTEAGPGQPLPRAGLAGGSFDTFSSGPLGYTAGGDAGSEASSTAPLSPTTAFIVAASPPRKAAHAASPHMHRAPEEPLPGQPRRDERHGSLSVRRDDVKTSWATFGASHMGLADAYFAADSPSVAMGALAAPREGSVADPDLPPSRAPLALGDSHRFRGAQDPRDPPETSEKQRLDGQSFLPTEQLDLPGASEEVGEGSGEGGDVEPRELASNASVVRRAAAELKTQGLRRTLFDAHVAAQEQRAEGPAASVRRGASGDGVYPGRRRDRPRQSGLSPIGEARDETAELYGDFEQGFERGFASGLRASPRRSADPLADDEEAIPHLDNAGNVGAGNDGERENVRSFEGPFQDKRWRSAREARGAGDGRGLPGISSSFSDGNSGLDCFVELVEVGSECDDWRGLQGAPEPWRSNESRGCAPWVDLSAAALTPLEQQPIVAGLHANLSPQQTPQHEQHEQWRSEEHMERRSEEPGARLRSPFAARAAATARAADLLRQSQLLAAAANDAAAQAGISMAARLGGSVSRSLGVRDGGGGRSGGLRASGGLRTSGESVPERSAEVSAHERGEDPRHRRGPWIDPRGSLRSPPQALGGWTGGNHGPEAFLSPPRSHAHAPREATSPGPSGGGVVGRRGSALAPVTPGSGADEPWGAAGGAGSDDADGSALDAWFARIVDGHGELVRMGLADRVDGLGD